MPAKRCVETKNMCLLFVDYCNIERKVRYIPKQKDFSINEMAQKILLKGEEANS